MSTILILLSIWYLVGLVAGIAATYVDWREGHSVRLYHLPLTLLGAILGPILAWLLWSDEVADISDTVLIPGRTKP